MVVSVYIVIRMQSSQLDVSIVKGKKHCHNIVPILTTKYRKASLIGCFLNTGGNPLKILHRRLTSETCPKFQFTVYRLRKERPTMHEPYTVELPPNLAFGPRLTAATRHYVSETLSR